ncbi:spermidine/putrescine transport system substrate-binding protein [Salirhabdus euzebyi]|uniref:Spermidine/putrescine transport system substrate-binding protein n=1 Tax=Salirhabdus euzebyi TaxID=394506 RepID=A0A841Q8S2_9BACI|nr:spermidine/putrescine ABC transporter substrate-binding protein [Salirhabdus euzebyi]MBB6454714.1 spermidine/putrescine transport system substrate-binding protein [Salirhabdus euzebyi]
MKHFVKLFLAIVLVLLLAACGSDDAGGSSDGELADKLYLFNWGEYMPQEVLDSFEEEFGVEVVYSTYSSNQEMLTKLNSGTVNYDIVVPTDYIVKRMINDDLLLELNMDNIPNFENIQSVFHERDFDPDNKFSVPYLYGSTGIAYNTTKIEGTPSYADLWNEAYAGHVTVQDDPRESLSMVLQTLGLPMNDPSEEDLQKAKEELAKLHPNLLAYDSSPSAQLISGEAWISHTYSGEAGIAMLENPDITYVLPEEGGELWMDNLVIPKTSENQYTAEVFINYLLEPEVSKQLSDAFPYSNPNQGALDLMSEEERTNAASYPPEDQLANAQWFEDLPPETIQTMNRLYKEVKVE